MTIDERLVSLLQSSRLLQASVHEVSASVHEVSRTVQKIVAALEADGENSRGLGRIAKAHERRISDIEGNPDADSGD